MKMRSAFNILSALIGVVMLIVSCHREDIPYNDIQEEGVTPISFSAINASLDTKGEEGGSVTSPAISTFRVWASRTYGPSTNLSTNNQVFGLNGTDVTYNNNVWAYSPVRYWQTGSFNFIAASHTTATTSSYTGLLTDNVLVLNFTSPGWNLSTTPADLILATATATGDTQLSNPTNVSLAFTHQLSKVKFRAKNVDSRDVSISITGISIKGNHKTATVMTYTMSSTPAVSWEYADDTSTSQNINLKLESGKEAISLSKTAYVDLTPDVLMFPETCTLEVTVDYSVTINGKSGNDSKSATISTAWSPGKIYEYQINFTSDHITFAEPTVTDWIAGGSVTDNDIPF